ncbi:ABC transporter permease [Alginatibacterium sediminis]|uniref:ABC transporter permease n=1 Tax=Alginatibacterium sediminis TaxID=2164068 RepID=A0A420E6F9_9ALTE|nr:FtsX-like permease family protein [Alginatibacterium sediminis]RKF13286.1 ABC transporter permease [Alginatibacterium sediminis]
MMVVVKLAWRNIWRQQRRTWLSSSAIALALVLSLFMRSMQEGSYAHNLLSASKLSTGVLQLQDPNFEDSQSSNDLISLSSQQLTQALSFNGVQALLPRLQSPLFFSGNERSKAALLIGFDADAERAYSALDKRIKNGTYFQRSQDQQGQYPTIIMGHSMATFLKLNVGDSVVLFGQGRHGNTAADRFSLIGTINYPNQQLESQIAFVQLKDAQQLLSSPDLISSILVHANEVSLGPSLKPQFEQLFPSYRVLDWRDSSPEMAQQFDLDRISGQLMILALYVVVGFGLFATVIMMTLERRREFAMLLASGLTRYKLAQMLGLETIFMSLIGLALGLGISIPLLGYFALNPIPLTGETAQMMLDMGFDPILPFNFSMDLFQEQLLIVFGMSCTCLVFPLVKAFQLNISQALSEASL